MTNILASVIVTVLTNVSETFPLVHVPVPCPDNKITLNGWYAMGCTVDHGEWKPDPNAKEKYITTNVIETTQLDFEWYGPVSIQLHKTLSSVTVTQKLEWVQK